LNLKLAIGIKGAGGIEHVHAEFRMDVFDVS
jgi:hypothetical protein